MTSTDEPDVTRRGGALPPPRVDEHVVILPFDRPLAAPPSADVPPPPAIASWAELAEVLDEDATAVVTLDATGTVVASNRTFRTLVGARSTSDLQPGRPAAGVLRSMLDHMPNALRTGGIWHGTIDHQSPEPSGTRAVTHRTLRATVVADPGGPHRTILLRDVTPDRALEAELRHDATHDPLTGLANRHHLLAHLAAVVGEQRERRGHVAAVFIDLDHLKYVNDAFGHRAGDQLLASTARRLERAARPEDRIGRIGGDEFLVVCAGVSDAVSALELAERFRRALSGHLRVGDLDVEFSVSIGVALTDADVLAVDDADAAELLVAHADTAMYAAKQGGRGRSVLSTITMRRDAWERNEIAASLARAVADETLEVEYQPVYSTVTGRPVGAEALVRWSHPDLGDMDPARFIAIAEESGTIARLGEQVLERALDDLAHWRATGVVDDAFVVHVNISRVQLASATFVDAVLAMLRSRRIRPGQLVLEARETSLLGRIADVDRSIRAFRRLGVQIAVDNFGTGPKALAVMTDVGADVLKLDGGLALPAGSSETDTRLVRAVVLLAHALEMDVVAERVTSPEQLARLIAAGCDMAQGHLLGAPAHADAVDLRTPAIW